MRTQIRDAVYETNSSSSHSVTVAEEEMRDFNLDKETIRKGVITAQVFPDGYGWQWVRFYKPENVLAYLLYQAYPGKHDDKVAASKRGVDIAAELKAASPRAANIIDTVEKATGLKVEFVFPAEDDAHFYVDHESMGNGLEFADPGREEELLRLIFGRGSFIELGNDNSQPGEYIESDIGDILASADKMVDEPLNEEATFTADFSTGYRETESEFIDADGVAHRGVLSMGWMQSIMSEMRGVTITDVDVTFAPDRFGSLGRTRAPVADQSRECFFKWLNDRNKVEEYRDYGDEGPTDIRLLRDFRFGFTEVANQRGTGSFDERTRLRLSGVGSRAQIDDMAAQFEDLLERSNQYRARREAEQAQKP
ncbi:hypothetical protein G6L37_00850 [Agrobacterium rubi]|nr:hypothetical protein [Agrobacterium rubi]NTF23939.1 hypothetical protein [Agrobacterium rubi]